MSSSVGQSVSQRSDRQLELAGVRILTGESYFFLSSTLVMIEFKTESIRKSSNINFSWTKIEYQNNLNPIALFSTLFKSLRCIK